MPQNDRVYVTLGPQGRLVVPASVRRGLGLERGDQLSPAVTEGRMVLEPRSAAGARTRGLFKHLAGESSVVDELIAERREAARREDGD